MLTRLCKTQKQPYKMGIISIAEISKAYSSVGDQSGQTKNHENGIIPWNSKVQPYTY